MTINADQALIEQARKSEDEQRARAEVPRQGIDQLAQQAVEARLLDAYIRLKADATQTALEELGRKTDAARKAEDETREATNHVQKAEADLKAVAARLEADARDAETMAHQKMQQAQAAPADQALQQAAIEAEKAAQAKQASANTAKATAERPETDQNVADLRKAEQNALAASSTARGDETATAAAWEKARREEDLFRSKLQPAASSRWPAFWSRVSSLITPESLIGAALLFLGTLGIGIIAYAIFFGDFLVRVRDVNVARGLITFLVALSAVIIAMIVTLFAIVSTDKELLEKKFGFGKEIFTAFVGILGTIIGFYFATAPSGDGRAEPLPPFLSFDPSESHSGDKVKFTSLVYTGKAPFDWEISSEPEGIAGTGFDADSYIEAQLPIPAGLSGDYTIKLMVTDGAGNKVAEPEGKLKIIGESAPQPAPTGSTEEFVLSLVPDEVKAGESFTLESTVPASAGTPAFDYTIAFDPEVIPPITDETTKDDGQKIRKVVETPAGISEGDYTVKLKVIDSTGKALPEKERTLKVKPK